MEWWDANLVGRDEPERALGFRVIARILCGASASQPALGRGFLRRGGNRRPRPVIVLSDGLWRRRFGADPAIVGTADPRRRRAAERRRHHAAGLRLSAWARRSGRRWPSIRRRRRSRSDRYLTVIGRLRDGRSFEDAQAQMAVDRGAARARLSRRTTSDRGVRVYTLSRGMSDVGTRRVLALWQAAALFVLLIACANIANLLLARGAERGREIAVRLALGSSRGRIVRESLLESVLLASSPCRCARRRRGCSSRVIRSSMPARIDALRRRLELDGRRRPLVAITRGARRGRRAGLRPAAGAADLARLGLRRAEVGRPQRRRPGPPALRRALVVAEIALVLPLLVAAMLSVSQRDPLAHRLAGLRSGRRADAEDSRCPRRDIADADSRRRFAADAARSAQRRCRRSSRRWPRTCCRRATPTSGRISRSTGSRPSSACSGRSCRLPHRQRRATSTSCACRSSRDAAFARRPASDTMPCCRRQRVDGEEVLAGRRRDRRQLADRRSSRG